MGARLVIVGHSLGAAVATLALFDVTETMRELEVGALYTFGSPRLGNSAFAKHMWSTKLSVLAGGAWRHTHWRDPVPHLPLEAMDFAHVPTEVWFNEPSRCCNKYLSYAKRRVISLWCWAMFVCPRARSHPCSHPRSRPRLASPRLASPRLASPRLASSRLAVVLSRSSYTLCDGSGEDSKCANSLDLFVSVDDHLHYFGHAEATEACFL